MILPVSNDSYSSISRYVTVDGYSRPLSMISIHEATDLVTEAVLTAIVRHHPLKAATMTVMNEHHLRRLDYTAVDVEAVSDDIIGSIRAQDIIENVRAKNADDANEARRIIRLTLMRAYSWKLLALTSN